MNSRSLLLSITMLAISGAAFAQDKLYKRNGDIIEGKVKEISAKTISYQRADNPEGPVYVIEKNTIDRIEYQNGSEELMDDHRRMDPRRHDGEPRMAKQSKIKYRNNIIALAPLQINDAGFGVGLSYERVLDKKGIISFYLPLTWAFTNVDQDPLDPLTNNSEVDRNTFHAMPGLKIYPTGSKGKVRYSVGPSIAVVYGEEYRNEYAYGGYPYYSSYYTTRYYERFSLGMMVNNTLNINPTPHLYLGLELGLGICYLHTMNNVSQGQAPLAQFGFRVGYRF